MNTNLSIQFLGAVGTVTGSKHLLSTPKLKILVDCGLYQGLKELRLKNREPFPIDVKAIDVVLITHAHLDHCGYIPLLVKNGYKGPFIMTPPTKELVKLILIDSAKIQEEEARQANEGGYSKHSPAKPLYTEEDVEKALLQFEVKQADEWIHLNEDISFQFLKNGHILGSSFIELKYFDKTIVFSGDIGRYNSDLLPAPTVIKQADVLVLESTYGDRNHPDKDPLDELESVILNTIHKKGNLIIPSFAVGRAQEIMFLINELKEQKRIPTIPVYLDSPMGADATEIFLNNPHWHKLSSKEAYKVARHIEIIRDFHDTDKVLRNEKSKIIIAASGMLTGGRVLNYIQKYGEYHSTTILLVGYQGEGTRGRALKDGDRLLKIKGKSVPIYAEIVSIDSLSAHGDQNDMITWLKAFDHTPPKIFLVHGEPEAQQNFKTKLEEEFESSIEIPTLEQVYHL